jgi:threonine dehydratase
VSTVSERIADFVTRTPLIRSADFSRVLSADVYF